MADELEQDVFQLKGGLDLVTGKLVVPSGTMMDCQNFDVSTLQGYARIDGFERYDGRVSTAIPDYFVLNGTYSGAATSSDFPVGTLLVIQQTENIFGIVVGHASGQIHYVRINQEYEPVSGNFVYPLGEAESFQTTSDPQSGNEAFPTRPVNTAVDQINAISSDLRDRIESPNGNPIVGLHWFRDRLYAVVDETTLWFSSGDNEIIPGMIIEGTLSGAQARVLAITLISGDWGLGTAGGRMTVEYTNDLVFTSSDGFDIVGGAALAAGRVQQPSGDSADYAALWQSRTEQQALDELTDASMAGWERIPSGWAVNYIEGLSASGYFTKVTRGAENNFDYDSGEETGNSVEFRNGTKITTDTPTGGGLGGPKVSNGDAGWKSTDDTTVYATTDAAITTEDSEYLYGDLRFKATSLVSSGDLKFATYNDIGGPETALPFEGIADAGSTNSRVPLVFKNLSAIAELLPDNSVISGIEIGINYDSLMSYFGYVRDAFTPRTYIPQWINGKVFFSAYYGSHDSATNTFSPEGTKQNVNHVIHQTGGDYTYATTPGANGFGFTGYYNKQDNDAVIGGAGNTFGAPNLSKDTLSDPNKALVLFIDGTQGSDYPEGTLTSLGGSEYEQVSIDVRTLINHLTIKIYFTEPSARYYISDGVNVISADLIYYTVESGNLENGDATGEFQFVNIQTVTGTKNAILDTDTVHVSNPPSAGNQVAVIDGDMYLNGLPSLKKLNLNSSRYQFITANFYANEAWDGFYGANGADRGFSYARFDADNDGDEENYLIRISTNLFEPEQDKPRHVAYYNNHLVYGLKNGAIRISVINEPESFSGEDYATQYFGGGAITGLKVMKGTMLCVGAENSISAITGQTADNFATQSFNPTLGILEYTMADMGGEIVFCTPKGITTLSQTDRYGDFMGARLSEPVSPWIVPRMRKSKDLLSLERGAGVVCMIPVRGKNQARLFFNDGQILTMTYKGEGVPAEFTFQRYFYDQDAIDETDKFIVPLAWSSQVDQYGVDRIHISHYSPKSLAEVPYVLELDRGWGFDGKFIPANYTINWYPAKSPLVYNTIRKLRIDGQSHGLAKLKLSAMEDYGEVLSHQVDLSLPRNFGKYYYDLTPKTNITDTANYGRQTALKFESQFRTGKTINDPEPAHVQQVLVVWFKGGALDG